jgi:uncharacterized protein YbjT (DUF2867 family)
MADALLDAVTGAFSFTGRAIAALLLTQGRNVVTLVRRPDLANPFGPRVRAVALRHDDPAALVTSLAGVDTLYNTLWIRFPRGELTYEAAAGWTVQLVEAARRAGVRRLVHLSVVNASEDGPTAYFVAKARLEEAIHGSGLSYAIVRPTLTFGSGDILVNNLCWVLRRVPLFAVPGDGRYRLQPVHVDDVAAVAIAAGASRDNVTVDAAGPEVFAFEEFVEILADAIGRRVALVHLTPALVLAASRLLGFAVRDVLLTRDEVTELMASLLVSPEAARGTIGFRDWVQAHADELGRTYHSELARHFPRPGALA